MCIPACNPAQETADHRWTSDMKTILLTPDWDITLDKSGNIALAPTLFDGQDVGDAYAQAQDAASEIKLFRGELYYDTNRGIPYWQEILGYNPSVPLMTAKFAAAALLVPGVVASRAFIQNMIDRQVNGQVQITNDLNVAARVNF